MEKENDPAIIPDHVFLRLLQQSRNHDEEATLKLLELFEGDIDHLSKYIYMPREDAASQIIVEFLEFLKQEKQE
ncbi:MULTISPECIES: hypothetical protein [Paenibacillus]|uniref:hypothetical protein n=1 Tax=Paenibacillus TaxID=44249 RepID=UPI000838EBBE|nr:MULTISPECIES: hypothetical protein [Paenibacillus]GIP20107.1 hypothetical protein J22TS3_03820 [Paenibacillus sp. J22TS3]